MKVLAFAIAALLAGPVHAIEFVETNLFLDDESFYRVVACGAAPEAECSRPMARWPQERARTLTVGIANIDADFPTYKLSWAHAAVDEAIAEINAAGADLRITRRADGLAADIPIYLTGAGRGEAVSGTGYRGLDGSIIQAGLVTLWWQDGAISTAAVALSADVRRRSIRSVMLEELVQALGLSTDIRGPAYRGRSIFDEDTNAVTQLLGQDADALRRHYPLTDALRQSASQ